MKCRSGSRGGECRVYSPLLLQANGTSSSVLTTTWSSSTCFTQNYAKIPADIAAISPIFCEQVTFSALVWLVYSHHDSENGCGHMFAHARLAKECTVPSPLNGPASALEVIIVICSSCIVVHTVHTVVWY